jgi:photoactive yellow protein
MSILPESEQVLAEAHAAIPADFQTISINQLATAAPDWLDALPFGVIGIGQNGKVAVYNATEATFAGLIRERVIGRPFFLSVAPCMNNYLVAQRFIDEPELDVTLDYMLTFHMRPTPVRLRLLNNPTSHFHYILVRH